MLQHLKLLHAPRAAVVLLLAALLCACGGGDDDFEFTAADDPNQGGKGWVQVDQSSVPAGPVLQTIVDLRGRAFYTDSFVCCSGDAVSDTGVRVRWVNTSTGASGQATQKFTLTGGFFPSLQHSWSARIPLAPGANSIQVTASDTVGGGNYETETAIVHRLSPQAPTPPDDAGSTGPRVRITSMDPMPNASDVALDHTISIVFSEPLGSATVSASSVFLLDGQGNVVEATVEYANLTATLDPARDLVPQTTYRVFVTGAVRDLAGNALDHAYDWEFTTRAAPDVDSPEIVATTPPDGSECEVADVGVTTVFSEPIDPATLTNTSFRLVDGNGNPVPASVAMLTATRSALRPGNALNTESSYTATVSADIADFAGNRLMQERSWSFAVPEGTGAWQGVSESGSVQSLYGHSVVWTGKEVILWGGVVAQSPSVHAPVANGARYDPSTDTWTPMSEVDGPPAQIGHAAVWTGQEMIVWGVGGPQSSRRYDPQADAWRPLSFVNAPLGASSVAIWTGTEMLLWTPLTSTSPRGIGRYSPEADSWRPMSTLNEPTGLAGVSAVWTGSRMLVWGDIMSTGASGGSYDPVADAWEPMNMEGAPSPRADATVVWTGTEMAVWGGRTGSSTLQTGALYNPVTRTWRAMSTTCAASARTSHSAVWTGSEMLVWGGMSFGGADRVFLRSGARYDPATNTWRIVRHAESPSGRHGHVSVWTGMQWFIWGGVEGVGELASGGRHHP